MPIVKWRAFVAIVFSTSSGAICAAGFSYILNVGLCCGRSINCGGGAAACYPILKSGGPAAASLTRPSAPTAVRPQGAPLTRSHYSLLATVEAIFNLGTLGRNDTSATPMSDLFRGGIP